MLRIEFSNYVLINPPRHRHAVKGAIFFSLEARRYCIVWYFVNSSESSGKHV